MLKNSLPHNFSERPGDLESMFHPDCHDLPENASKAPDFAVLGFVRGQIYPNVNISVFRKV